MARRRRTSRNKKGSGAAGAFLAVLFLLLAAAGAAGWLLEAPFGPQSEVFVDVTPGSSTSRIGQQLESAGVVESRYAFDIMRIFKRGTLRAGEYRFDHPASVVEVYNRIARGDVFTKAVTIPEGATIFDIAARLEQAGLVTQQDFLRAQANDAGLVADLDPGAKSLEGYLFPDTYYFPGKTTAQKLCAIMVRRFKVVAVQLGLKENVHRVVTMASLVERETAVDADRPLVASVFENRLTRRMPLMTDPSVIYGLELERQWRGKIYESDLKRNTPYNTYLHLGLPPGPVANPGLRSLRAAMAPAQTNYLYFVAEGTDAQGHSLFSASIEEHEHNVAGYRRALKKAGGR
jgi:UPF0755 protein